MTIIFGLIGIWLVITLVNRLKHALHMLQQCHYMNDRFATYNKGHKEFSSPFALNIVAGAYVLLFIGFEMLSLPIYASVLLGVLAIYGGVVAHFSSGKGVETKLPLKMTARVWRLVAMIVVLMTVPTLLAVLLLPNLNSFMVLVGALLILNAVVYGFTSLGNACCRPIEARVRLGFINDARRIIKESKQLEVVGITGSYGKTSTKHTVHAILSEQFNTLMTPESYNTPMGITITVRNMLKPIHRMFIAEMGAYKPGEILELCEIAYPKYGILTSVGPQHLETYKTIDNVKKTKSELIEYLPEDGIGFINIDDDNIREYAESKLNAKCKLCTYAIDREADYRGMNLRVSEKGTTFDVRFKDGNVATFTTKLLGQHNIYNTVAAIALGYEIGIPVERMQAATRKMKPVSHRLEIKRSGNFTIIDDAFNSNPVGSKMALEVLGQMKGKRIVVTPGMVDLGTKQYELNKAFGTYMKDSCDYVILVGKKQTEPILEGLKEVGYPQEQIFVGANLTECLQKMNEVVEPGAFVLLENDLPELYAE